MAFPTYNGQRLPGFNPLISFSEPRWMIVWDDKGWTCPCRRVIVCFNGRFVDKDGNSWDNGSEPPNIGWADIWWKAVSPEIIKAFYAGTIPPWFPDKFDDWYQTDYLKGLKYL